jgi:hypothetical protein
VDECAGELQSLLAYNHEMVAKFEWGCDDATHTGWALVDAEDKTSARMLLPMLLRGKAKVVRVRRVQPEDVTSTGGSVTESALPGVLGPSATRHQPF